MRQEDRPRPTAAGRAPAPRFPPRPPPRGFYRSRMATVVDQAVCIRQWDWSETSQTVSLFGREQGLVRAIAKGSKRGGGEGGKFSGGLEVLTRGEMTAIIKSTPGLATLTAWDLQETFPALRTGLSSFYSGMYIADLVQHMVTERDPHPDLFDAMLVALRGLGAARRDRVAVLGFQWATLDATGYRPRLEEDVLTGEALGDARLYAFLPSLGGLSVEAAKGGGEPGRVFHFSPGLGPVPAGPVWRVRRETVGVLRTLDQGANPGTLEHELPDEAIRRASRLLASYLRHVAGRDMASMAMLFGETPR